MRTVPVFANIADASVATGTTRLTDLGALVQTALGDDLGGTKVMSVRARGSLIGSVGGVQSYAYALFIGPGVLDVADVAPNVSPMEFHWWTWNKINHRGQAHDLSAGTEFDEILLSLRTRGSRRLRDVGETLWFAEETVGQAQNAFWTFQLRATRA